MTDVNVRVESGADGRFRAMPVRIGSLFSGYGGLDLGVASVLGGEVVWHSDILPASVKVLEHRFPGVPNLGDITAVDWSEVEPVEVLTGGFPCQDVSTAGMRRGLRPGTRSGLWTHFAYAIEQLQPRLVVIENVRGLLSAEAHSDVEPCPWCVGDDTGSLVRALGAVLGSLAELGYDAAWHGVRAAEVGAPHGRFRVFIVAYPADAARERSGLAERDPGGRAGDDDGVSAGALLPTPRTSDSHGPGVHGQGGQDLRTVVDDLLPTPVAANTGGFRDKRPGYGHELTSLFDESGTLLPTPTAWEQRSDPDVDGRNLLPLAVQRMGDERLLPTPAVNDMGEGKDLGWWDEWREKVRAEHDNGNGHGDTLAIVAQRYTEAEQSGNPDLLLPTPTASPADQTAEGYDAKVRDYLDRNPQYGVGNVQLPLSAVADALTSNPDPSVMLPGVADRLLPTPVTSDERPMASGGQKSRGYGAQLRDAEILFPTPQVQDSMGHTPQNARARLEQGRQIQIAHAVGLMADGDEGLLFPTPTEAGEPDDGLDGVVDLLPTPNVMDKIGARSDEALERAREVGGCSNLKDVRDSEWGAFTPAVRRWEAILGRPAPAPTQMVPAYLAMRARRAAGEDPRPVGMRGSLRPRAQLAPVFVEWMMGLDEGWVTGVPGLNRNEMLTLCGNGVVPQQAAAAVALLLRAVTDSLDGDEPEPEPADLLPTPRVASQRTSRESMVRDGHWSAPGLEQAVELARGELPREFRSADEVPGRSVDLLPTPKTSNNENRQSDRYGPNLGGALEHVGVHGHEHTCPTCARLETLEAERRSALEADQLTLDL